MPASLAASPIIRGRRLPHTIKRTSAITIKRPKRKFFSHTAKATMIAATMMEMQYHATPLSRHSNSGASHVIPHDAMEIAYHPARRAAMQLCPEGGERQDDAGARIFERASRFKKRGAGRRYIVHEEDVAARERRAGE